MKHIKSLNNFLNESVVELPDIPNTITMWHGGNLDSIDNNLSHKTGRFEYGAGLYISDNLNMILNYYAKGNRKLYLVTVEKGMDIEDALLDFDNVKTFIKHYVKVTFRKSFIENLSMKLKDGKVPAYRFNNMILNHKALSASKTNLLRKFLVENGVDYEMTGNPSPNGGRMLVVYNMNKVKDIIRINHKDVQAWNKLLDEKNFEF
jgi:hypothetical protein